MISENVYKRGHVMNTKTIKDSFDYFDSYKLQAAYAREMACNLQSATQAGELGTAELMDALHTVENDADQVNHDIQAHLQSDFVVPFERDGMGRLAHALDDVCDAIEDVAIKAYCQCFTKLGDAGNRMVSQIADCAERLMQAAERLGERDWKNMELKSLLVGIQDVESACDRFYIEAVHGLYEEEGADKEQRRIAHAMLDTLEDAMDAMEDASECIEALVAENA